MDQEYNNINLEFQRRPIKDNWSKDDYVSENDFNLITRYIKKLFQLLTRLFKNNTDTTELDSNIKINKTLQTKKLDTEKLNIGNNDSDDNNVLNIVLKQDQKIKITVQNSSSVDVLTLKNTANKTILLINDLNTLGIESNQLVFYRDVIFKGSVNIENTLTYSSNINSASSKVNLTQDSIECDSINIDDLDVKNLNVSENFNYSNGVNSTEILDDGSNVTTSYGHKYRNGILIDSQILSSKKEKENFLNS